MPRAVGVVVVAVVREIDRWFIDEVLIHAAAYHRQARRWAPDAEAARDIVQEAYARVIAAPHWRDLPNPKAYVMVAVRNIAIDRLRHARVVPFDRFPEAAMRGVEDEQPSAFDQVAAREELARVRAAVQALPRQRRRVVELRRFEDCSLREIAVQLKISVSTVEKHLVQGLRTVMETMARTETEPTDRPEPRDHQRQRPAGGSGRMAGSTRRRNG